MLWNEEGKEEEGDSAAGSDVELEPSAEDLAIRGAVRQRPQSAHARMSATSAASRPLSAGSRVSDRPLSAGRGRPLPPPSSESSVILLSPYNQMEVLRRRRPASAPVSRADSVSTRSKQLSEVQKIRAKFAQWENRQPGSSRRYGPEAQAAADGASTGIAWANLQAHPRRPNLQAHPAAHPPVLKRGVQA